MTGPLFTTTGRRMTRRLQAALDTVANPAETAQALEQPRSHGQPDFDRLLAAIAFELRLRIIAEAHALHDMETGLRADVPDPPLPKATGRPWWPEGEGGGDA